MLYANKIQNATVEAQHLLSVKLWLNYSTLNCKSIKKYPSSQDFKGLSVDKLEKYFLLLAALDENLAEYKDIKHDLKQVKHNM